MKRITRLPFAAHQGFTIIEFAIVIPILILVAISMFNILLSILNTNDFERDRLNAIHDKEAAIDIIESDVALSSRYLTTIDSGVENPYPPTSNGGTWSYKGDSATSRYLILRTYSTTENPLSGNRQPVFKGSGTDCDTAHLYFNEVQRYNVIYFVKNNNLYRKRLVNTSAPTCSTQYQKLSCPSKVDLGTNQLSSCKADDELLLSNVSSFTVNYYPSRTSTTASDVYASGADTALVTGATDAEVIVTVSKKSSGKTMTVTGKLRMTKLNMDL